MGNKKRLLTLDQLVEFCQNNKFKSFDAEDSGYTLSVQIPGTLDFSESESDDLLKVLVRVCHTELNRNNSFISEENMKKAMPTLKYKPLLASIITNEETGELDFNGHDMEIVENEDGTVSYEYIEKQVGTFTTDEPYLEYDAEMDKTYVMAYAVIPRSYTKAAEIIERKNGTKVSCELCINKMAYNAKEKYLELEDFYFAGCACLGEHVGEGMLGSRLDIVDFSTENNSVKFELDQKLIDALEKLNTTLSNFNNTKENLEEGGTDVENEIILNEEVTTEDEIVGTVETIEEETPVENESVEEVTEETTTEETVTTEEEFSEEPTEETPTVEESEVEEVVEDSSESEVIENELKYSISYKNSTKEFSLSMNEKIEAISNLVNDTYSETDNTWYSVICYDETKEVIMVDYWTGRAFRQSYKCKKDAYSLTGDRIEVYATYLTVDEQKQLEQLKANYSLATDKLVELEEKLNKYETEPQKEELLNSDKFNLIKNAPEFIELKKQENHFDLSVEEVETKAKDILLSYAMNGKFEFSAKEETPQAMVFMGAEEVENEKKPYGGIFDAFHKNKNK